MRKLVYIPMVHGPLNDPVDSRSKDNYFRITRYFNANFHLSYVSEKTVYVYMDGLVALDDEKVLKSLSVKPLKVNIPMTISEYVRLGKTNCREPIGKFIFNLDQALPGKQIIFMGTDDPHLMEETDDADAHQTLFLVDERDKQIGPRISQTLPQNSLGILFMGTAHKVHKYLSDDIQVEFPLGEPNFDLEKTREIARKQWLYHYLCKNS